MRRLYVTRLVFACALISGCVTRYQDVSAAQPHAILELHKGYTSAGVQFGGGTTQNYSISAPGDDSCGSLERAAIFSFIVGGSTSRRIAAGQSLKIYATTSFEALAEVSGGTATYRTVFCAAEALFTPEANHTYSITQREVSPQTCVLEVLDVTTGAAPPDLTISNDTGCNENGDQIRSINASRSSETKENH